MPPVESPQVSPPASAFSDRPAATDVRSLIRSEERLQVGTERSTVGSVRLEKYLVTETRTVTVELAVERVRLVRTGPDGRETVEENPVPTAPSTAGAEAALGESSRWLVLHEERVTVTTEHVPVERVRLDTYLLTDQRRLTEPVRAERIEMTTEPM